MQRKSKGSRNAIRRGRKPRRSAGAGILAKCMVFCVMAFAAFAVFREFQPFGSKMGQETAVQRSVGPDGAEPETEGQVQEPNASRQNVGPDGAEPETEGQVQEPNAFQPAAAFSDMDALEAGSIFDVSGLSQPALDSFFYSEELPEEVQQRMMGSSYQENGNISLAELRYLRVLHMGFDGNTHIGELVVNQSIAEDILEIMSQLYAQSYPIEKMVLIDAYGADDESSMSDNNTSAFNYREIAGSSKLSKHALGLAIDVNPKYNPYVKGSSTGELLVSPANGADYADRDGDFPYKIAEGDLCLQLFQEHGFAWGGNWNSVKDYQHFEK